jgi:hypothetical protein
MKYNCIHKYFLIGIIITSLTLVLGYFELFNQDNNSLLLKAFYLIAGAFILSWTFEQYLFYKFRYVHILDDKMIVHIEHDEYSIPNEEIDGIFVLKHRDIHKIYHIIHVFTKSGEHFCFSKNLNHFSEFKSTLETKYKKLYYERAETCSINLIANKDNLYRLFFGDSKEVFDLTENDIMMKHLVHHI